MGCSLRLKEPNQNYEDHFTQEAVTESSLGYGSLPLAMAAFSGIKRKLKRLVPQGRGDIGRTHSHPESLLPVKNGPHMANGADRNLLNTDLTICWAGCA